MTQDGAARAVLKPWLPGHAVLGGEFVVERELGSGAFGTVSLLVSRRTGVRFAAKRSYHAEPGRQIEFLRELRHWLNLSAHPHLAACRFVRTTGPEVIVFADFAEGGSLADWIADGRLYAGGPATALRRILGIAVQSAWGVEAAHALGVVHQDLKPGNVLISTDGAAMVGDFGLAAATYETDRAIIDDTLLDIVTEQWTRDATDRRASLRGKIGELLLAECLPATTELVPGRGFTVGYASPEQAEKKPVSFFTDVWSWGVIVLEMFSGSRTWLSGTVAAAILDELSRNPAVAPVPVMPPGLVELLRSCFKRRPEDRPASMGDVGEVVRRLYGDLCGSEYPHAKPPLPGATNVIWKSVEREWHDPRRWLLYAAGLMEWTSSHIEPWWPVRTGTAPSQLLSDLVALEQAARVIEPLSRITPPELYRDVGELRLDIARVHLARNDDSAALAAVDRAVEYLDGVSEDDKAARTTLVRALLLKADLLRRQDAHAGALAACDRGIAFAEHLAVGADNPFELLADALSEKVVTVAMVDENVHDSHRLAIDLYNRMAERFGLAHPATARAQAIAAMALLRLGNRETAAQLWTAAEATLRKAVSSGRKELRHPLAEALFNHALAVDSPEEKLACYVGAIEVFEALAKRDSRADVPRSLGMAHLYAADLLRDSSPVDALRHYASAVEWLTFAATTGEGIDVAHRLGYALSNEAVFTAKVSGVAAAIPAAERAVQEWRRQASGPAGDQESRHSAEREVARSEGLLAWLVEAARRAREAGGGSAPPHAVQVLTGSSPTGPSGSVT